MYVNVPPDFYWIGNRTCYLYQNINITIIAQGRHGQFLADKASTVAATSVLHYVPDRQILFKKSLMVLKDPYGSPEVPYTPESQNPLLKKFQIIRYV